MPLTEEEKEFMEVRNELIGMFDPCTIKAEQYYRNLINRLVAENEELKLESIPRTTSEIEEMLRVDKIILQAKLDAIKKVWEPIREDMLNQTGNVFIADMLIIEALDRLIGGEK